MQNIDNKKTEKKTENKAEALTEKKIQKQKETQTEKKTEGQIENDAIQLHKELKGKIEITSKSKITKDSLKLLYTPGVAYPCLEISKKINLDRKNSKEKYSKENNNKENKDTHRNEISGAQKDKLSREIKNQNGEKKEVTEVPNYRQKSYVKY